MNFDLNSRFKVQLVYVVQTTLSDSRLHGTHVDKVGERILLVVKVK